MHIKKHIKPMFKVLASILVIVILFLVQQYIDYRLNYYHLKDIVWQPTPSHLFFDAEENQGYIPADFKYFVVWNIKDVENAVRSIDINLYPSDFEIKILSKKELYDKVIDENGVNVLAKYTRTKDQAYIDSLSPSTKVLLIERIGESLTEERDYISVYLEYKRKNFFSTTKHLMVDEMGRFYTVSNTNQTIISPSQSPTSTPSPSPTLIPVNEESDHYRNMEMFLKQRQNIVQVATKEATFRDTGFHSKGDLALLRIPPDVPSSRDYYEMGEYIVEPLQEHKRVVVNYVGRRPHSRESFVFATKDYSQFVLVEANMGSYSDDKQAITDMYRLFNPELVTDVHAMPSEFPESIEIDGQFSLHVKYFSSFVYELVSIDESLHSLDGDYGLLRIYDDFNALNLPLDNLNIQRADYYVMDTGGLIRKYTYQLNMNEDDKTKQYSFSQDDITLHDKSDILFEEYGGPVYPFQRCVTPVSPVHITGFIEDDIKEIGVLDATNGTTIPIYTFIGTDSFSKKIYDYVESYKVHHDKPISYEEYIQKYSILLMKDTWNRWIAWTEVEYAKDFGGCGKPVIYLYPDQTTDISISFVQRMDLTMDIPSYHQGWYMRANPDGTLYDLQPQYTDCSQFLEPKRGSEYAYSACNDNVYPYIYWAGKVVEGIYPTPTGGWYVSDEELESFINQKLIIMGLNNNEIQDFMEYWIPSMREHQVPYYRIAFLQTDELNVFLPMDIEPYPDTMIRVFMDWDPLSSKPITPLKPQQLIYTNRGGFVLVEWGGVKR